MCVHLHERLTGVVIVKLYKCNFTDSWRLIVLMYSMLSLQNCFVEIKRCEMKWVSVLLKKKKAPVSSFGQRTKVRNTGRLCCNLNFPNGYRMLWSNCRWGLLQVDASHKKICLVGRLASEDAHSSATHPTNPKNTAWCHTDRKCGLQQQKQGHVCTWLMHDQTRKKKKKVKRKGERRKDGEGRGKKRRKVKFKIFNPPSIN